MAVTDPLCQSSGLCEEENGSAYPCDYCSSGNIYVGDPCPLQTDPLCSGCTFSSTSPSHTFYLDTSATSSIYVEDYASLFNPSSSCGTPTSCSTNAGTTSISISALGEIAVSVTSKISIQFAATCNFGSYSSSATVLISVVCGANSTTLVPSTFTTSQTYGLAPGAIPSFAFSPYASSTAACSVTTIASDSAAPIQSTQFSSDTTSNTVEVSSANQYVPQTLSFFLVFQADGGVYDFVAVTLITSCTQTSVPLDIADYPDQRVQVGSSASYTSALVNPVVTGCTPTSYYAGSSSSHLATPSGLNSAMTTALSFTVAPSDYTIKSSYNFYLWIEMPGSVFSNVGPISLQVGCLNYIDSTLTQSGSTTQKIIGSSGTAGLIELFVEESNVGTLGQYRLEFQGFGTTNPTYCPADISSYAASSDYSSVVPLSEVSVEAYTVGDSTFKVMIDTAAAGTFSFYIRGQDTETRWDNIGISSLITVRVVCGSEVLSASSSPIYITVTGGTTTTQTILINTEIAPLFTTSISSCPASSFSFFSDSTLTTPWSDSSITIGASSLQIQATSPGVQTIFVQGTTSGGLSTALELKVVVCGNEIVSPKTTDPEVIVFDVETVDPYPYHIVTTAEILAYFEVEASTDSHADCMGSNFIAGNNPTCSTTDSWYPTNPVIGMGIQRLTPRSLSSTKYICLTTKGQQIAVKQFQVEICGLEGVTADGDGLERNLTQSSQAATIEHASYSALFASTSQNCGIRTYSLNQSDDGVLSPYSGSTFQLNTANDLIVDASQTGEFLVLIEGAALIAKAYLPVKIIVTEAPASEEQLAKINLAPQFMSPPEPLTISATSTKESITLSEVVDSLSNYCGLYVSVPSMGQAFVSNSSEVKAWEGASSSSSGGISLELDPPKILLEDFSSLRGSEVVAVIKLVDEQEAFSTSQMIIKFEQEEEEKAAETDESSGTSEPEDSGSTQEQDSSENSSDEANESQFGDSVVGPTSSGSMTQDFFKLIMEGLQKEETTYEAAVEELQATTITLMEISRDGRVYFQFNQHLFVPFESGILESINVPRDIASIQVIQQGDTAASFSFTAGLIEWEADHLVMQLNFSEPLLISQSTKPDILEIKFRDPALFISQRSRSPIDAFYLAHLAPLPRQFPTGIDPAAVETAAKAAEESLLYFTIIQLVMQAILKGLMDDLWGLFFSLQLICYTQLFAIAFPPNAELFLQSVRNLIEFKALKPDTIVGLFWGPTMTAQKLVYSWMGVKESPAEVLTRGSTVIEELQIFIVAGLIAGVMIVLALVLSLFKKLKPKIMEKLASVKAKMVWSGLIRSVTISYCSIGILAKSKAESALEYHNGSLLEPVVIFAVALAFPILFGGIVVKNRAHLQAEAFSSKFGILINGLWVRPTSNSWSTTGAWLFPLLLARRWFLCVLPILFFSSPAFQLQGLIALTMLFSAAYFKISPHANPVRRRVEQLNQILVCLATYTMVGFSDFQPDPMRAFSAGYWLLTFLVGLLAVNVAGMIVNIHNRMKAKRELVAKKAVLWSKAGLPLPGPEAKMFEASASRSQKLLVEDNLKRPPEAKPKSPQLSQSGSKRTMPSSSISSPNKLPREPKKHLQPQETLEPLELLEPLEVQISDLIQNDPLFQLQQPDTSEPASAEFRIPTFQEEDYLRPLSKAFKSTSAASQGSKKKGKKARAKRYKTFKPWKESPPLSPREPSSPVEAKLKAGYGGDYFQPMWLKKFP